MVGLAVFRIPSRRVALKDKDLGSPQLVVVGVIENSHDEPGPERGPARQVQVLADDDLGGRVRERRTGGTADRSTVCRRRAVRIHFAGGFSLAERELRARLSTLGLEWKGADGGVDSLRGRGHERRERGGPQRSNDKTAALFLVDILISSA